tara:strand:+ start:48 stop:812 length:765 start_codon:yes stop_codon:yes gene_type:complete
MSDCGCGCNGAGNCTDNLNSNTKNAQLTGNINYDGSAISCTENSSIDIISGEGLNSIIQKVLNVLCPSGSGVGNKLMWNKAQISGGNSSLSGGPMANASAFTLSPNSGQPNYVGNGVRVRMSVSTKNVASGNLSTLTGTGSIKLDIFGFDGSIKTADYSLINIVLAAGTASITATSYLLTYEFYRDSNNLTSDKVYGYWKLESNDGSVINGSMSFEETIPFSLTTNKIGFSFKIGVTNPLDSIWNYSTTVELIK